MALPSASHPEDASFDLTPMIDVILLLIIFFMLTAQFAQTQLRPMDLPRESGPDAAGKASAAVVIDMDRDGKLSVFGQPLAMDELAAIVPAGGAAGPGGPSLIIRADRSGPAAHLNRLAERLVALGVREWRLATNPEGAPPSPAPAGVKRS
jgi:biopolymer transport protein ExbD